MVHYLFSLFAASVAELIKLQVAVRQVFYAHVPRCVGRKLVSSTAHLLTHTPRSGTDDAVCAIWIELAHMKRDRSPASTNEMSGLDSRKQNVTRRCEHPTTSTLFTTFYASRLEFFHFMLIFNYPSSKKYTSSSSSNITSEKQTNKH